MKLPVDLPVGETQVEIHLPVDGNGGVFVEPKSVIRVVCTKPFAFEAVVPPKGLFGFENATRIDDQIAADVARNVVFVDRNERRIVGDCQASGGIDPEIRCRHVTIDDPILAGTNIDVGKNTAGGHVKGAVCYYVAVPLLVKAPIPVASIPRALTPEGRTALVGDLVSNHFSFFAGRRNRPNLGWTIRRGFIDHQAPTAGSVFVEHRHRGHSEGLNRVPLELLGFVKQ